MILTELIDRYYQKSADKLIIDIKLDLGFNPDFKQGSLSIKDYAIKLGEFRTYYQQYKEADKKLNEIIKELKGMKE
jgi:hypothetical protein